VAYLIKATKIAGNPFIKRGRMKNAAKLGILVLLSFVLLACQRNSGDTTPTTTHRWTWVSGSDTKNALAVYGSQGTAAASNVPGAREDALSWLGSSGKLWLFGGFGYNSVGHRGRLNDLWMYDPTAAEWTWVSGNQTLDQAGIYGIKGIAAPSNVPGARNRSVSWIDPQGILWLFGGIGYAEAGAYGSLNDLWAYDPAAGEWTWVSGSNGIDQAGTYGTLGTADPSNMPGARIGAVSGIDAQGKVWLFGGYGYDSAGDKGWLNDLWVYDPTALQWTWISGSDVDGQAGTYGTVQTADASNVPGGRYRAVSWLDSSGAFWLFGGEGLDSAGTRGNLNDLWEYDPTTGEWTWMLGSETTSQAGTYGTVDTADVSNVPGARSGAISWTDSEGHLWLFGGYGYDSASAMRWLNDLWMYDPTLWSWAWISGSTTGGQAGTYGTKGTADTSTVPGGRYSSVAWIDSQSKLWLFGGYGGDSAGSGGWLNDLWSFNR
jgi:N-acetylneuraminic acid mutarotase